VLATNVAETSLTVPGIRYVVDPGTARISRYSSRLKVQRLPIEAVSQASANQRAGRCGRVEAGVCIRLYSEEDYLGRPEFTDPEILRTNLASVILQMTALGLGEIEAFPFVDPPDRRNVRDGVQLLEELGALDAEKTDPRKRLTPLGRQLATLPVDPRLGRMVLEADRNGCVHEVLVIAAALSIQDPRERPVDKQQAADASHARFADPMSDFLAYLELWRYLQEQQRALSSSAFRRMCKAEFLHYLRVREWQDLYGQLRSAARSLGIHLNDAPAAPTAIHTALLSGLLSHIGLRDAEKNDYIGARGARWAVFPGSALFKKPPRWAMAAELVETSRLWGRMVGRIEPEWIEPLAAHLVLRSYNEPHWEARHGAVVAYERITLYGIPIVTGRKVTYSTIDPPLCRELFIRTRWSRATGAPTTPSSRPTGGCSRRCPSSSHGYAGATSWSPTTSCSPSTTSGSRPTSSPAGTSTRGGRPRGARQPDQLTFTRSLVMPGGAGVSEVDYPDAWPYGDLRLRLSYQFEPGTDADGVTVQIPLAALNRVEADAFSWQIPGLREELLTALIRTLPKALRRSFVPAPNYAKAARERLTPYAEPVQPALARELTRIAGVVVMPGDFDMDRVPAHLRMTFRVVADDGQPLGEGIDLDALKRRLQPRLRETVAHVAASIERSGVSTWDFGELPKVFEETRAGHRIVGYPALVDEGGSVAIRVLPTPAEQQHAMARGVRRLLRLNTPSPVKGVLDRLPNQAKLALTNPPHPSAAALFDDCVAAALDAIVEDAGGVVWDADGWGTLLARVRAELPERVFEVVTTVARILSAAHEVQQRLVTTDSLAMLPALRDMKEQLAALVHPGFVAETGAARLPDLVRYVQGIERRLDKVADDPGRDRELMRTVHDLRLEYADLLRALPPARRVDESVQQIRWMIEELRISYFAQTLKAAYPVSEQRILRALDQLTG
jgi:ATP-dependent helicase HrpA